MSTKSAASQRPESASDLLVLRRYLISPEDAADHLGIAVGTLAKWRVSGDGPPFIKLSHRAVRYEQSALDAWLDARRRSSTSGV